MFQALEQKIPNLFLYAFADARGARLINFI